MSSNTKDLSKCLAEFMVLYEGIESLAHNELPVSSEVMSNSGNPDSIRLADLFRKHGIEEVKLGVFSKVKSLIDDWIETGKIDEDTSVAIKGEIRQQIDMLTPVFDDLHAVGKDVSSVEAVSFLYMNLCEGMKALGGAEDFQRDGVANSLNGRSAIKSALAPEPANVTAVPVDPRPRILH